MTALNPLMTIGDQVAETLRLHLGLHRDKALEKARLTLDRVGMPGPRFPLTLYPHELSGGQVQRISILRALTVRPRYLVADEITAPLDPASQARLWHALRDIASARRIGVLAISHDRALLDRICCLGQMQVS